MAQTRVSSSLPASASFESRPALPMPEAGMGRHLRLADHAGETGMEL